MSGESTKAAKAPAPNEHLLQIASAYHASACLYAATQLKIADLLAAGPKPVAELARAAQADEDALYRILRALASVGIFTEAAPRAYANTPASELLRADVQGSQRNMALWITSPFHFRSYAELVHSAKTGAQW
jgi:predicted transcriptional regulator